VCDSTCGGLWLDCGEIRDLDDFLILASFDRFETPSAADSLERSG
jgi:hypothetical protein